LLVSSWRVDRRRKRKKVKDYVKEAIKGDNHGGVNRVRDRLRENWQGFKEKILRGGR